MGGLRGLRTNLSKSSAVKNMTAVASKYHQVSSQVAQFSSVSTPCIAICEGGSGWVRGCEGVRVRGWEGARVVRGEVARGRGGEGVNC